MGQISTTNCYYDSFIKSETQKITKRRVKSRMMSLPVPGEDGARISKLVPHRKPIKIFYHDATTLVEALERGRKVSGDGPCVGWRSSQSEYSWLAYSELIEKSQQFGSGLMNVGADLGQNSIIGIYGKNSIEWSIAMYGCMYYSSPIIPLYDTLGPDACSYMINHGNIRFIICGDENKVRTLIEKKHETPTLEAIVCFGDLEDDTIILGQEKDLGIYTFESVMNLGTMKPYPIKRPQPGNMMEVCYTSGTTGSPKGVMLTHENWMAMVGGLLMEMGPAAPTKSDVMISYLPLAHVYEQFVQLGMFTMGGSVGYCSGDVNTLLDDMKVLKPTIFPAVPRMLNKLYDMAQTKLSEKILGMNDMGYGYGMQGIKDLEAYWNPESCKDFAESLGGNIKRIFSAAAPISDVVLRFYRQVLGCYVCEMYGQTEATGPCTVNLVTGHSFGHVGAPLPCCIIKLIDVPELDYYQKDGKGEVCVKGYNVFQGYYKDPKKTAQTIDKKGWIHTGDVAEWTPTGALKIIDRIKDILKLSQGEYVSPGKLENIYLQSPYISQIFVHGDSLQNHLVAIVIPDQSVVMPFCEKNLAIYNWEEACKEQAMKKLILGDMNRLGKEAGLMSFEKVKKIHVHPKLLTHQDDQLTPTQKTRRTICAKYFAKQIEIMYFEKGTCLEENTFL